MYLHNIGLKNCVFEYVEASGIAVCYMEFREINFEIYAI